MNAILEKNKGYIDITNYYLNNSTPDSYKVKEAKYFKDDNGNKYYVDNKNVVLDYSPKEKEVALWLSNTFGDTIYMLPRVNKPDGIKTADYLWKNEKWDLKEITTSGKRVIDNRLNGEQKKQSCNFIIDISTNVLSNDEIINQIIKLYSSKSRSWVNQIILIRDYKLIKIIIRKKD